MNSKWPNILCLAGVGLIGWSLFIVHHALCIGFFGSSLTLLGVRLHRKAGTKSIAEPAKEQE